MLFDFLRARYFILFWGRLDSAKSASKDILAYFFRFVNSNFHSKYVPPYQVWGYGSRRGGSVCCLHAVERGGRHPPGAPFRVSERDISECHFHSHTRVLGRFYVVSLFVGRCTRREAQSASRGLYRALQADSRLPVVAIGLFYFRAAKNKTGRFAVRPACFRGRL